MRQLPNALSVSRIALAPVIAILLLRSHGRADWSAGLFFGAIALTDQVDGVLARIWHARSAFGMLVDPLADKLLIGSAIYCLILGHRLPWLALVLPFARHFLFWGARFLSPRRGMISPSFAGKISAWMLYPAVGFIIVTYRNPLWALWLFWIGILLTFVDVIRYVYQTASGPRLADTPPSDH